MHRPREMDRDLGLFCVIQALNRRQEHGTRMDSFDVKLLAALQADGRLTNPELAELVGLSASQCSRRRLALEQAGVIASYHAHLAPKALGLNIVVFVQVTLATHSPDNSARFRKLIAGLDEVQEAYSLTGAADYQVKLVLADLDALNRILNDVFLPHDSIEHVHSSIALDCLKQSRCLPLDQLGPAATRGAEAATPGKAIAKRRRGQEP